MEVESAHRTIGVAESSQASAARFLAREFADAAGFGEEDAYRAGLVATEMATNLFKHARGGEFLARATRARDAEVELMAIDRGPGIRDISASMIDGHSTAGTAGTGLGAVRRLSDEFDLFSDPRGTVVFARVRARRRTPVSESGVIVGAVSLAKAGEPMCGDVWHVRQDADGAIFAIADGVGHGLHAFEAATATIAAFGARHYAKSVNALEAMHDGARHTRGAAAAIASLRRRAGAITCAGVGNVSTAIVLNGAVRQAVSHNGTLGHEARVMREYTYPWTSDALLIMHTDGLATHWSLDEYRGLRQRHPAVIAAALYRDHSRGRDDVTVLVGREAEA